MKQKAILYGVCGIGNGHTQRQLPLIEYFAKSCQIVIFAYDTSYDFFLDHFRDNSNITVLEVAVPFYVGKRDGIDFEATKNLPANNKDYDGINDEAAKKARQLVKKFDLVISDYEPICAQYSYENNIPLITIDQQSKYLTGEFPETLHGQTYMDETARLKLFFPTAAARIACSFFDVAKRKNAEKVTLLPPILKESILITINEPSDPPSILVYLSAQKEISQNQEELSKICSRFSDVNFHIFVSKIECASKENVLFYKHGDSRFGEILKTCSGVISTAGHSLLSEAMYLNIPVYAIPLAVYEQQMNAEIIGQNNFGIRADNLNEEQLGFFLQNLSQFRKKIADDKKILIRGNGLREITNLIESRYLK